MAKRKLYALLSAQGTACSETVLSKSEYDSVPLRERVERQHCRGREDDPLPGTWTDVSDNDALNKSED